MTGRAGVVELLGERGKPICRAIQKWLGLRAMTIEDPLAAAQRRRRVVTRAADLAETLRRRGIRVSERVSDGTRWFDTLCQVLRHGDTNPSFSFADGQYRLQLICRADCTEGEILAALGLTRGEIIFSTSAWGDAPRDEEDASASNPDGVTLASFAKAKGFSEAFLRSVNIEEWPTTPKQSVLYIPYYRFDGSPARARIRSAPSAGTGSRWDMSITAWEPIVPYGEWMVERWRAEGKPLLLVEGESDALSARYGGLAALGIPGAQQTQILRREHVEGFAQLYIQEEPDEAGAKFATDIREWLSTIRWPGQAAIFTVPAPDKDLNDFFRRDPNTFTARLRALLDATRPILTRPIRLREPATIIAPPVRWQIMNHVPAGMLTILSGKDGLGKTLLGLEMVKATLTGQRFLSRFYAVQGPVVALLLDDPAALIIDRLTAMGIRDHPDLMVALDDDVNPDDPLGVLRDLGDQAIERRARFILIDALYKFIPTSKDAGNDVARMRPILDAVNRLSERTGAAVELIAHDNRAGQDVAGSYAIRAGAKVILRVQRAPTAFERELWARFWELANDPEAARQRGVRARHGEAVSTRLRKDRIYVITLRSTGELTIQPMQ